MGLLYLDLVNEDLDVKGGVEVNHGVRGVEHHYLTQDFVYLACSKGSNGPVRASTQTQLLVLTNALKHLWTNAGREREGGREGRRRVRLGYHDDKLVYSFTE